MPRRSVGQPALHNSSPSDSPVPGWLPDAVLLYLSHTEQGVSLRALARQTGVNASTVLRQVRRYENRRDDPLMDAALEALRPAGASAPVQSPIRPPIPREEPPQMTLATPVPFHHATGPAPLPAVLTPGVGLPDEAELEREARRVLRRLAEPGAVLAFAPEMERAVVMRQHADGRSTRTAILDRRVAQAFSLKDWIGCTRNGRVSTYEIAPAGRAILRRLLAEEGAARRGLAEAAPVFAGAPAPGGTAGGDGRPARISVADTPVAVLARRLDRDGRTFLAAELVQAAERLREDYELAQLTPRQVLNWDRHFPEIPQPAAGAPGGVERALAQFTAALADLGPGLADVALRVCCLLEGVESAERRMGWSARSGKIVLRIALQRLRRHYDQRYGRSGPLIG